MHFKYVNATNVSNTNFFIILPMQLVSMSLEMEKNEINKYNLHTVLNLIRMTMHVITCANTCIF